jgi:hypothetical protein
MPTPVEVRRIRINYLIIFAKKLLEAGVPSHLLCDKLERASFRLWPALRDKTRREYVVAALKTVLSRPTASADILPQETRQTVLQEGPHNGPF